MFTMIRRVIPLLALLLAAVPVHAEQADLPGVKLWYTDTGGSGVPIILLHANTGTSVVWEISPATEGSLIRMTHQGLTPAAECYEDCQQGWSHHINDSLYKYITEQVGMPE